MNDTPQELRCRQKDCEYPSHFRYTWPGQEESFICLFCARKLLGAANAMHFRLQLIPLTADDHLRMMGDD